MKTMLDILKERLPEGLEIIRTKDLASGGKVRIWFRYQGYEVQEELQKTCAPGYSEKNCDFTINNAMLSISLKKGDVDMMEYWRDRLLSRINDKPEKAVPIIRNQSPHQHLVG